MSVCLNCKHKCCKVEEGREMNIFLTEKDVERLEKRGREDLIIESKIGYWLAYGDGSCEAFKEGKCEIYSDRPDYCRRFPYNFVNVKIPESETFGERLDAIEQGRPRWNNQVALFTDKPRELSGRESRVCAVLYSCDYSRDLGYEEIARGLGRSAEWIRSNWKVLSQINQVSVEQLEMANLSGRILAYSPVDIF